VTGSGFKGGMSSIGLSGSSSGFSTGGGSWYVSIKEYSRQWTFQGMGTRGLSGGWSRGDDGLDSLLDSSSGRSGRGDGFNGNGCLAIRLGGMALGNMGGGVDRVMRRGSDN